MKLNRLHDIFFKQSKDSKPGLWANIHAKRKRGEAPAKPGSEDYPDSKNWKKVTEESEKKASPAWQRSEGKNPEGGLNEKGRASLRAEGRDIKRPQPEGGARKDSFCARMKGMKAKLTSEETANDPDSRINKSLRKWKCGSAADLNPNYGETLVMSDVNNVISAFSKKAYLENIYKAYKELDPTAQAALLGGGAGAAIGGIGNALFGKRKKGVGILGRFGRGLLAGGALGGLGGAGINEAAIRYRMATNPELSERASAIMHHAPLPADQANKYLGAAADYLKGVAAR
jgi:hypothetical protein